MHRCGSNSNCSAKELYHRIVARRPQPRVFFFHTTRIGFPKVRALAVIAEKNDQNQETFSSSDGCNVAGKLGLFLDLGKNGLGMQMIVDIIKLVDPEGERFALSWQPDAGGFGKGGRFWKRYWWPPLSFSCIMWAFPHRHFPPFLQAFALALKDVGTVVCVGAAKWAGASTAAPTLGEWHGLLDWYFDFLRR